MDIGKLYRKILIQFLAVNLDLRQQFMNIHFCGILFIFKLNITSFLLRVQFSINIDNDIYIEISIGAKIFLFLKFLTCFFFKKQKPVGTVKNLLTGFVKIISATACGNSHFWYICFYGCLTTCKNST